MSFTRRSAAAFAVGFCSATFSLSTLADIWVFEPSVTLDQRFDDNYFLIRTGASALSATRGVVELGLSREAESYVLKGLARVDALLTTRTDVGDEDLDSNQIFIFDASRRTERGRYGVEVGFKQDTPSRDIAADVSDPGSLAEDTGILETQSLVNNVARREIKLEPRFEYDLTRRLQVDTQATLTAVEHELPSAQDVIYQQYLTIRANDASQGVPLEPLIPYGQVILGDEDVFSPTNELDDYLEAEAELGLRFKLTPIVTLTATAGYSRFVADVLPSDAVQIAESQFIPDSDEVKIRRKPRREAVSTTTTFKLGYERFLTPTLQFSLEAGVYTNTFDNTDTFRADDALVDGLERPDLVVRQGEDQPRVGRSESDGWLANTSLNYDAGATRYEARFAVDVQPSSSGAQVETNELKGSAQRVLSPRLIVSLRARAFEPDRLGARLEDRFARRFISFEPNVQYKYTRNWTVSAAFRYRRQKARVDFESAESNALLFAIKYTPPSKVRDAAQANGL